MKWRKKRIGDKRTITKFAWFPITSYFEENEKYYLETRWLCFVTIHQRYYQNGWQNEHFVN